jgi:hypothetical protein
MAINLQGNGIYLAGQTVRIPPCKATGKAVWGDVVERNGAAVVVEVRAIASAGVGRVRLRTWNETYTVDELNETARRFTATLRRASA